MPAYDLDDLYDAWRKMLVLDGIPGRRPFERQTGGFKGAGDRASNHSIPPSYPFLVGLLNSLYKGGKGEVYRGGYTP